MAATTPTTPVSVPIGVMAVALGATVLATAVLNGTWTTAKLTLALGALVLADLVFEETSDGGVTWVEVSRVGGAVGDVAEVDGIVVMTSGQPRTSGQVRASVAGNSSAFATTGGSWDVS